MEAVTVPESLINRFLAEAQDDQIGLGRSCGKCSSRLAPAYPQSRRRLLWSANFWLVGCRLAIHRIPPMDIAPG